MCVCVCVCARVCRKIDNNDPSGRRDLLAVIIIRGDISDFKSTMDV